MEQVIFDKDGTEYLCVERKKVVEEHKCHMGSNEYGLGYTDALEDLFGDKCLPDKESEQSNLCDTCSNELKDSPDCSYFDSCGIKSCSDYKSKEQPRPRFKVGDKVIHNHKNREVGEVAAYFPEEKFCYSVRFGKEYHNMAEHQLEPYTEPETKDAYEQYREAEAEKYKNQLKDMEEKELGKEDNFTTKEINRKALYDALCELEAASIKVRKALIRYEVEITD